MTRDGEHSGQDVEELMGELRVAIPGAEVLFAFLLTVPFTARFGSLVAIERSAYFVAFIGAAAASILLIAPSGLRQFRRDARDGELVSLSAKLAIAGLASLGVALVAVVLLVTHVLYGNAVALVTTVAVAIAVVAAWFMLPVVSRRR